MLALTAKGTALTHLVGEVARVHAKLLRAGDALAAPVHLNSARKQLLTVVAHGAAPVAHIARELGLTRQSVQQTADALVDAGFAAYAGNPHHERAKLVTLTAKGKRALAALEEKQATWANAMAGDLALKDLESATVLLRQLQANLGDDL